jgi:hypothetical protein
VNRDTIRQLAADIDRAMDEANVAGYFAIAGTLSCALIRAIGIMRRAHESKHAANICATREMRAWRRKALKAFDIWESQALNICRHAVDYCGLPNSTARHDCAEYMQGIVDVGWLYMQKAETGDIDITQLGNKDGKENDEEGNGQGRG